MGIIVLTSSPAGADADYDVQVGPLAFVTPADTVGETIGDGVETVGAAIVASDRRPRPLKLKLPVRASDLLEDPAEGGRVLRRQLRQLFDNARWRLQGFYFVWDADPDLDGWLQIGGGDLSETDPGISFGEFELDLTDVYIVGRPGTHRPGRRAIVSDRRTGRVARDTRRLLFSTDFATQALPTRPLTLPGDVVDVVGAGMKDVADVAGATRGPRTLWRQAAAQDGEVLSFLPNTAVVPGRKRYLATDDLGSVRVWDRSPVALIDPDDYTADGDTDPRIYGWERVYGDLLSSDRSLVVENGVCRLVWLGPGAAQGLAVEFWDDALGHFRRQGRILHALNVREQSVVEITPERGVLEWRVGQNAMRVVLQRGWWGPRLESYNDGGNEARLEYVPVAALSSAVTATPQVPAFVIDVTATDAEPLLWAQGTADEVTYSAPVVLDGTGFGLGGTNECFGAHRERALVAQLAPTNLTSAADLAALSLVDARSVPVLIGRH